MKSNSNSCRNQRGRRGGGEKNPLHFYIKRGVCGSHFYAVVDNTCFMVVEVF